MRNAEEKRIIELQFEWMRRSLRRRRIRLFLRIIRNILGRRLIPGRNEGGPGFSGFRRVLGCFARHGRDADEMLAAGALNLAPGKLLVTLQMLAASGAGKFEFVHDFESATAPIMEWHRPNYQCEFVAGNASKIPGASRVNCGARGSPPAEMQKQLVMLSHSKPVRGSCLQRPGTGALRTPGADGAAGVRPSRPQQRRLAPGFWEDQIGWSAPRRCARGRARSTEIQKVSPTAASNHRAVRSTLLAGGCRIWRNSQQRPGLLFSSLQGPRRAVA